MTHRAARSAVVRRSVQVTGAASAGFYAFLYGLGQPVSALYALFAPIALGLLSSVPGSGRQQAAITARTLPAGVCLVALGTQLAQSTAAAVAGMLAVGFVVGFAAVAGPRAAGAAPGLHLMYILACFPPYAPQTLGARLAGLAMGVVLLALGQAFVLPAPAAASYRERLADALGTAAAGVAEPDRVPVAELGELGQRLRWSKVAPGERPAGPGRTDRALAQAGAAVRRILDQLISPTTPFAAAGTPPDTDPAGSAALLDRVARTCDGLSAALRRGGPPPAASGLEEEIRRFQKERARRAADPCDGGPDSDVLGRQAAALALAESTWIAATALGIAAGKRPTPPIPPRELFWYSCLAAPRLWGHRIAGNLTERSVWFQNAVRVACGLAVARLVAGSLDLTHGFWVLLAVLTLGRTTAGATWRAVRQATAGTLVGAVAAGGMLVALGPHRDACAVLLVPGMLIAFTLGPRLGVAWAQGLFTLVVSLVFAQITPTTWRLSEARIIDVVTGCVIGLVCGLLAWPAGARREVHRAMAALLRSCGTLLPATADALLTSPARVPAPPPTFPALHRLRMAEAAYAQFGSEPPVAREGVQADWHAVVIVAYHMVMGAQRLPRFEVPPSRVPPDALARIRTMAAGLEREADRIAARFIDLDRPALPDPDRPDPGRRPAPPRRESTGRPPPEQRPALPAVVDLEVWLTAVGRQLTRIEGSVGAPEPAGS
jgi:hypothetical protein